MGKRSIKVQQSARSKICLELHTEQNDRKQAKHASPGIEVKKHQPTLLNAKRTSKQEYSKNMDTALGKKGIRCVRKKTHQLSRSQLSLSQLNLFLLSLSPSL
jgi:hypothetical protein